MLTATKQRYLELAETHTCSELSDILGVAQNSIRRYAREFGIKPKPGKFTNLPASEWAARFSEAYSGKLELAGNPSKTTNGHLKATCRCLRCGHEWTICVQEKIRTMTGCEICDKGNWGNKYSIEETEAMLNKNYSSQWKIVKYGSYSKKNSIVKCTLCGTERTVKLADMANTTTCRCTTCQTGSFGEYVIATTLAVNEIPFEREKRIDIDGKRYRLDFMIDGRIALEYSGSQHFEKGLYYSKEINDGVDKKRDWCLANGYEFHEQVAAYDVNAIVTALSSIVGTPLKIPSPEDFRKTNPDIATVLSYMKTHSSRQTSKDLHVSIAKIRKYVTLDGYPSIAAWQAANQKA